ncbi:ligand-binding sensor domain-containing protein [Pedobacter jejuensis]|uniref:Transcriptional regulator n=1 Tax=Pedobacter jejuensis TaxID=1268550 RepID=A0A3N0BYE0_9SPHI|nr:triple tyrosine motif-containing protein [Pedobacter jejuensis]RNL54743.1 transcriptional regulator [Pedobacter jejuensis]
MRKFLLVLVFFIASFSSYAQDLLGIPQVVNYNNEQYNGGVQNWDVQQDKNGILYFGNNEGLLTFNGRFWNLYRLPNFTSVRSLGIDSKNRIYVGAQDEIGYFFPDDNGILKYHSLLGLVPENLRKIADIWDISIINDEVFFRSVNLVLHYKDDVIKAYKPTESWSFLGKANNKIYAQSKNSGLLVYDKELWKPVCTDEVLKQSSITSISTYSGDTLLVSTLKKGFFLLHNNQLLPLVTKLDNIFFNDRIFFANQINKNLYAVGTTSGGVYLMNKHGELVQKYNYREGLQNNNVRGILLDYDKNMWLALDDGIAYVAINSAIKSISPDRNKQITSYAFRKVNQNIYVATSNGLYTSKLNTNSLDLSLSPVNFEEVKNTKGQVWGLDEINNQLIMAHEDGSSMINNNVATPIYSLPGTWMFQPLENVFPAKNVLAGTYLGLQKINYTNGVFKNGGEIKGISETLRFIVVDNDDNIWASHPYHGVYKIQLSDDKSKVIKTTLFSDKNGLPFKLYNYVYRIKNRVVIATIDGIYEYDQKLNRFLRFKMFGNALNKIAIQYLKEDNEGNVWFVSNKKVGIIDFHKPSGSSAFSIFYLPELDGKVVGGFENIYTLDNENVFIGANKGAYHINYDKYLENIAKPKVVIGSVKLLAQKDSTVFGGYFLKNGTLSAKQDLAKIQEYKNALNSLHFEFASTLFEHEKNTKFSYQLVGFDDEWSAWSNKSEKDYTNLPAGKYTFNVKGRTDVGNESEVVSYTFTILPAWYNTIWMKILYLIIFVLLIRLLIIWQRKKHIKEQDRMSYLHQLEIDRSEKEIVRLQNEKLEADVNYKNKELSTMTMHLVQRGKVLAKIKEVISSVIKNNDDAITENSPSFRHLIRLIKDVEKKDQELEHLSVHFNHVNTEFFNKLKDLYPDLSQNDLKFCAYLCMNLSSKEMAQLMNITIKAVEVGRYRLRKKLQLKPEINLYEFLVDISRQKTA